MALKFLFFRAIYFFLIVGILLSTWNLVIINLPIKGITLSKMPFQLACELAFYLLIIGTIGIFVSKQMYKWEFDK